MWRIAFGLVVSATVLLLNGCQVLGGVGLLQKPRNVAVSVNNKSERFDISWQEVANADSYNVQYYSENKSGAGQWLTLAQSVKTTFTTFSIPSTSTSIYSGQVKSYYFKVRVKAISSQAESEWSDESSADIRLGISEEKYEIVPKGNGVYSILLYIKNTGNIRIKSMVYFWQACKSSADISVGARSGNSTNLGIILPDATAILDSGDVSFDIAPGHALYYNIETIF